MKTIIHKANTRGHYNFGWLDTWHTFSFGKYYNSERNNFGALRVLNDDTVEPGEGFGRHPHDNMEIISIPLEGSLLHRDSMGNEQILKTGEVQVMSAGNGIFHEEYNGNKLKTVNFLQIWIFSNKHNIAPIYNQKEFDSELAISSWQTLVSPFKDEALSIHQDAIISRVFLSKGETINYQVKIDFNCVYLFIIEGKINMENIELDKRDGLGLIDAKEFDIKSQTNSYILTIEIPNKI